MISVPDKTISLSRKQKERAADFRIGELEREKKWLIDRVDYLLTSVQALGEKLGFDPMQARECIDQFIIKKQMEFNEEQKAKFIQDLKDGKAPEFKIVDNTQKTE